MRSDLRQPRHLGVWLLLILSVVSGLLGCTGVEVTHYFQGGGIATAAPMATDIGLEVLRNGGNAFDAAVAIGFALAVVYPEAGNIGGGGFALVRVAATGEVRSLDFRERAPLAAWEGMYLDEAGDVIDGKSTLGALACGVPGTVSGLYELWRAYGSRPWEELVQVAAALADSGFVVDEDLAQSLATYESHLARYSETAGIFLPDGHLPTAGDRLVQRDLAQTLYRIAAEQKRGFYGGTTGDQVLACMAKHSGLITREDLEAYEAVWREPIHFRFDSLDVYSMPPPSSGGIVLGQILKLLEPYDLSRYTVSSPELIHLFCEMSRLAFADRAEHLGDPEYYSIPPGLLDSAYLDRRREQVELGVAGQSGKMGPGAPGQPSPRRESSQTTHYSVCDSLGNMVAVTYTLNTAYGSKLVVDGAGFLLNNEMDDFSLKPGVPNTYGLVGGEANKVEPGKRMLSSMTPTLMLKKGKPFLAIGSPGGSRIITVVAQTIIKFLRLGMSLPDAVSHARYHHQWLPDEIFLEEGSFDINSVQSLIRYGHAIKERSPFGDVQAIYIDPGGMMLPVSDPRGGGRAGGF